MLQYTFLAIDNGIEMTETLVLGVPRLVNVCQIAERERASLLQFLPLMIAHNRSFGRGDAFVLDTLALVGGKQATVGR